MVFRYFVPGTKSINWATQNPRLRTAFLFLNHAFAAAPVDDVTTVTCFQMAEIMVNLTDIPATTGMYIKWFTTYTPARFTTHIGIPTGISVFHCISLHIWDLSLLYTVHSTMQNWWNGSWNRLLAVVQVRGSSHYSGTHGFPGHLPWVIFHSYVGLP